MTYLKLFPLFFLSAFFLFACSCNSSTNNAKKNNAAQSSANDSMPTANSSTPTQDSNNQAPVNSLENGDTSAPNPNADSMFSQLKGITSMLGKNDSGILKSLGGGGNMNSLMKKFQSMTGGKSSNPGDAMGNLVLNLQLGQMKDNNPLKQVAKGMMAAQQNGTAGPSKKYTATYTEEQANDYKVPVSGNGNTIMLQYTGGSKEKGKKDGFWKNIYVSTKNGAKWNVYSEGYVESSAFNMKVHETSLSSINEKYSINTNEQYKKYNKQPYSGLGKYESNFQVQKIGNEKMFGYNSVHIKISYTVKALGQATFMQNEEWYSADVPGSQFLSPRIFENHSPAVVKKIMGAGCKGALVKFVSKSPGSFQLIQLSKIVQKDMPDSVFTLPANYQEDKNTGLYGMQ